MSDTSRPHLATDTQVAPGTASATGAGRYQHRSALLVEALALFWAAVAILISLYASRFTDGTTPDTYSYADAATKIAAGQGAVTDLLVYDGQLRQRCCPVAFTVHPPLFPTVAAVFVRFGFDGPQATLLTARIAFALLPLVVFGLARAAVRAAPQPQPAWASLAIPHLAAALVAFHWPLAWLGSHGLSDSVFSLIVTATMFLLVRAAAAPGWGQAAWALAAGLTTGLAFWTRYLGISLPVACGLWWAARWLASLSPRNRTDRPTGAGGDRPRPRPLTAFGAAAAYCITSATVMLACLLRNARAAGTVEGNDVPHLARPLSEAFAAWRQGFLHQFVGSWRLTFAAVDLHLVELGLILLGLAALVAAVVTLRRGGLGLLLNRLASAPALLIISLVVYHGALLLTYSLRAIPMEDRFLAVMAPVLITVVALGVGRLLVATSVDSVRAIRPTRPMRPMRFGRPGRLGRLARPLAAGVCFVALGWATVQVLALRAELRSRQERLGGPDLATEAITWLKPRLAPNQAVLTNAGFSFHHKLGRPYVRIPHGPINRIRIKSEQQLVELADDLDVRYVVLFPTKAGEARSRRAYGDYMDAMVRLGQYGNLTVVHRAGPAIILECPTAPQFGNAPRRQQSAAGKTFSSSPPNATSATPG